MKTNKAIEIDDAVRRLADLCIKHQMEVNVDTQGTLSLFANVGGLNFTLAELPVKNIKKAIFSLELFRKQGWEGY